ncbi:ArsR/SmtB family transcription factor [Halopelagius longus]|uniref:ArsR family transcriptional regulator n=1 Tax=Halopelagius longus TaxID=1236180 RepID=A0A1H1E713_9EURY|nr:winged helix-turn-helix domain-containing protein [Halopelagius longus]RDI71627.1 ArsR family transcriptional regulator [Halopelagius longus]SDQ84288.1 Helix-turn-helix domain-containing protein [Halopelagius longus]
MADILPSRPDPPDDDDKEPRVVGIDSEGVEDLLSAISSDTARSILAELHERPATPSEVADRTDTSIQNAQYHLGRLNDTGLVEESGTAYSEKGREMTVYAPADRALVVVAGQEDDTSGLQTALSQLLGGLGVVALGSVVVDRLARRGGPAFSVGMGSSGGAGGESGGGTGGDGSAQTDLTGQSVETNATTEGARTTAGGGDTPAPSEGAETAADAPTRTPTDAPSDGGFRIAEVTETPEETATEAARTVRETAEATRQPTEAASTRTPAPEETVTEAATEAAQAATDAATGSGDPVATLGAAVASLSPGELFLLGGLVTVVAVGAYWWIRK